MPKKLPKLGRTYLLHTPGAHHKAEIEAAVEKLEAEGWEVYHPDRNNDLLDSDTIGYTANRENVKQMAECDVVHILWDGKSSGFLFGLGMAFALQKDIKIVKIPANTSWRSFQNLITFWATLSTKK